MEIAPESSVVVDGAVEVGAEVGVESSCAIATESQLKISFWNFNVQFLLTEKHQTGEEEYLQEEFHFVLFIL